MVDKRKGSYYASPERNDKDKVILQKEKIEKSSFLHKLLIEVPLSFMILNYNRQVIYSNNLLLKNLGYETLDEVLGFRPGEMFRCIYARENPNGCGTGIHCQICGGVNTVLESDKMNKLVEHEARIITLQHNSEIANDFMVASKPFDWENERFFIVTITNIENIKKKERLERVFFHDIINKVGSLKGLLEVVDEMDDIANIERYTEIMHTVVDEIFYDIHFQRKLVEAEEGTLSMNYEEVNTLSLLMDIINSFKYYIEREFKSIILDKNSQKVNFSTDKVLLNRVLTNMLKNALEEVEEGELIHIGAKKEDEKIKFWVHNSTVIPKHVQMAIFQRSFSTKGDGRGMGTYSIKLFTEQYLKGKATFISNSKEGTVFSILLPVK